MFRIFIGYDRQEIVAYHVLAQSIIERSSVPVSITPIALNNLRRKFTRERDPKQSTDFSFSRFLVPHLCDFKGTALFMDCDMLCREDIEAFDARWDWPLPAVSVVKHDYQPMEDTKFLGHAQMRYQKKNWSSVMLFNNERCKRLTPAYVNSASGLELHQFKWLEGDEEIGELPRRWNHLVGVYDHDPDAALVHFTDGGPWFPGYENCDYAAEWFDVEARTVVAGGALPEYEKA